jgi:5-oxopent-3-ene-1,2,5-tricarboxylate decarboxylase / 2-hydroxyhepta-2,4-diene-1,7-dioate isomerase
MPEAGNGANERAPSQDVSAVATRLHAIPCATIKDVLRELDVRRTDLQGLSSYGPGKIAGPARTLRHLPAREDVGKAPRGPLNREAVDGLQPGEVLVIDAGGGREGAVLGDMLGARASSCGAAGVVADGVVRDVASFNDLGLSVFARGTHPDPSSPYLIPWERDVAVRCCGRLVEPGDWIVADADAVLVVPAALVDAVIERGEGTVARDDASQRLLSEGARLDDAYPLPAHAAVPEPPPA